MSRPFSAFRSLKLSKINSHFSNSIYTIFFVFSDLNFGFWITDFESRELQSCILNVYPGNYINSQHYDQTNCYQTFCICFNDSQITSHISCSVLRKRKKKRNYFFPLILLFSSFSIKWKGLFIQFLITKIVWKFQGKNRPKNIIEWQTKLKKMPSWEESAFFALFLSVHF